MYRAAKVLIIKWGALGDVIIASPHIEVIVGAHPDAEVHLLTAPGFAPLFADHPRLQIYAVPRRGTRAMLRALRWVWRQRFDVVYDLQGNERSALLTAASRASRRAALAAHFPYNVYPASDRRELHPFARLNALLGSAGLPDAVARPCIHAGSARVGAVDTWLREHGLKNTAFALAHAGASRRWPSKRWPAQYFEQVAVALKERGVTVIWVGGDDDRTVNARLAETVGIDATGVFSISELAQLAQHARFALANDSGPMHVIATADIPVYAFFGPTDWHRCHAVGQDARVLSNPVPCSPCYLPTCPAERGHVCMRGLPPVTAIKRLQADGLV